MADFDINALFSDYSPQYVEPWEPAPYSIAMLRVRTGKEGVDRCTLTVESDRDYEMVKTRENEEFCWYSAVIALDDRRLSYYFNIYTTDGRQILYTRHGVVDHVDRACYWNLIPGYRVPDWMRGAVIYQIYVDRFCNGDQSNDVLTDEYEYLGLHAQRVEDWNSLPQNMDVHRFYGGDLKGVLDKLDYLEELGINVIYFNPLFVSPSNHKYDAQDYGHIDPHVGKIVHDERALLPPDGHGNRNATRYIDRTTNPENLRASDQMFADFIAEAHRRGIRVIMDGVFNHCGSFNRWLDRERIYEDIPGCEKGAYIDRNSPYRNYFKFNADSWPYNGNYDGWWGHDTLPKLNYEASRSLTQAILDVGRKWVSAPYHADGWRLDVAADLGHSADFNHWFWREFRKVVKQANPDAVVLAENYGDSSSWLQGDQWDTVMNYDAFMEPLTWFLTGMEKHSDDFRQDLFGNADNAWKQMNWYWNENMPPQPMFISMNELSNHDHSRFLTRTNHKVGRVNTLGSAAAEEGVNKAVMREAAAVQFTWPGAPTIYYGDEAGLCGFTDPDDRRTYPWGREDQDLIRYHRELIRIHKENSCLIMGALRPLALDYQYMSYGRFDHRGTIVVAVNNGDAEVTKTLPVRYCGVPKNAVMERLCLSKEDGFTTEPADLAVTDGSLTLTLGKTSAVILRWRA